MNRGASRADTRKVETRKKAGEQSSASGAVQAKTSFADRFRSYWAHHRTSLMSSFGRLWSTPMQTLMTSLVVAIALALPATLFIALTNVQQLGEGWDTSPKMSAFIHLRARDNAIEQLVSRLQSWPEIDHVEYLSADEALENFQRHSGFGEALTGLGENPLPATLVISPQINLAPAAMKALQNKIANEAIVEDVSLDMEWVRRLQEMMVLGKKIVLALAALLSLGVLLAIGNTIRLAIESRRDEIVVVKLVGGTNDFVRRPFMYAGGWYGFFGGVLGCLIVAIGYWTLEGSVGRLAFLYQSDFTLRGLNFAENLSLLVISTLLGWIGARLAVGRHLSEIEPR